MSDKNIIVFTEEFQQTFSNILLQDFKFLS